MPKLVNSSPQIYKIITGKRKIDKNAKNQVLSKFELEAKKPIVKFNSKLTRKIEKKKNFCDDFFLLIE